MKNDLFVKTGIIIPEHELEITTSKAGGPGGQHVNKTESRITIRWNVKTTTVLSDEQKERIVLNLQNRLTQEGDLIVHNSASRSQQQNKHNAMDQLAQEVRKALFVPKKRMKTRISQSVKESRLHTKAKRGVVKKMRSNKHYED